MKDYPNIHDPINNNLSSLLTQQHHQIPSSSLLQEIQMPSHFDTTSSCQDEFLEQMMSSSFPWSDDQHQLLLSRTNGLMPHDHNGASSFKSLNPANDASVKSPFNGFTASMPQTSNQSQHFHQSQGGTLPAANQPAASGTSGGGAPRQRVRARRGQATDPHSIAERLRRERIAERMKGLQELVPNANKTDKASMLDEIIDYVKFLQLQVKVLSVSRLGGASAIAPRVAEGKRSNGTQTMFSPNNNDGLTVTEKQVAKLMEEDMGSAMQYLQGKGLCLMPISLATAISSATVNINGGPTSPTMSGLTVQSVSVSGEPSHKHGNSVFNP